MKDTSRVPIIRERNRCISKPSRRVANIIAKHYYRLRGELDVELLSTRNYLGRTGEDIFSDTVLYIIHNEEARKLKEDELIKLFKYRYNMIKFQTIKDAVSINILYGKDL